MVRKSAKTWKSQEKIPKFEQKMEAAKEKKVELSSLQGLITQSVMLKISNRKRDSDHTYRLHTYIHTDYTYKNLPWYS